MLCLADGLNLAGRSGALLLSTKAGVAQSRASVTEDRRKGIATRGPKAVLAMLRMRSLMGGSPGWCARPSLWGQAVDDDKRAKTVALQQQIVEFVRLRGNLPLGREFALSE